MGSPLTLARSTSPSLLFHAPVWLSTLACLTSIRGGHTGSKGQCRMNTILSGNDLILDGPEHVLEGGYISPWESHTGGGDKLILQSTGNQLPRPRCLSAYPRASSGSRTRLKMLASCTDLPSLWCPHNLGSPLVPGPPHRHCASPQDPAYLSP